MILFEHIRQFKQRHFERRTLGRCKPFSLLICRDISKFSLLVFFCSYIDGLPKNLFKITAHKWKKSTSF